VKKLLENLQSAIILKNPDLANNHLTENSKDRINIYADGYKIRLSEAVLADYPALKNYLGDEMLEIIDNFINNNPSNYYSLDFYPLRFCDYLKNTSKDPFAIEIAEIECAINEIFYAKDSNQLTQIDPATTIFNLRTAGKFLTLQYNSNEYVNKFRAENISDFQKTNSQNYLLIVRNENEVKRHSIDVAEYLFLTCLLEKKSLEAAIDYFSNNHKQHIEEAENNLQNWFTKWIREGFFND
jgi:hypothetical protein